MSLPSSGGPRRHIFICTGARCAPSESPSLYRFLKDRLRAQNLSSGSSRVLRSQCHCLGICEGGPLAVVYPEGIWYHDLDQTKLERVIQEHLSEGRPVSEFMMSETAND